MSSRRALCAALLAALSLTSCSDDAGGPKPITVGVTVTDMGGAAAAELCVRVPVLLGSVVAQQQSVGSAFAVELRAMRHSTEISFPGATNESASQLSLPVATLSGGYSKILSVSGRDGGVYSASVHTGCSAVNTESDP